MERTLNHTVDDLRHLAARPGQVKAVSDLCLEAADLLETADARLMAWMWKLIRASACRDGRHNGP